MIELQEQELQEKNEDAKVGWECKRKVEMQEKNTTTETGTARDGCNRKRRNCK